jgi:cytosine permease
MAVRDLRDVAQSHDDYALERVPRPARYHWASLAMQRFGQMSDLTQFLIGATLGFSMTFGNAFLALTFGAVIVEAFAILTGIAGQREGLSTSVLARWNGFGRVGSALIGLVVALSLLGWFGIQTQISGRGLTELVGVLPEPVWSFAFGVLVTVIAMFGFRWMAWTAYVTVPALLLLTGWSIISELSDKPLGELVSAAPAGPPLSLFAATMLVVGSFIAGAVVAPDMTRYNRTAGDVVKQTVVGITLGQYVVGLAGVLLGLALRTDDVIGIVTSTSGVIGTLVIISATVKINDWNLYSGSLGIVNAVETAVGVRLNRAIVAGAVGLLGSALAGIGILDRFEAFLLLLNVVFMPIIGIMVAEYFVVRAFVGPLSAARADDGTGLPGTYPTWVPLTLLIWLGSALVSHFVTWGPGVVNGLIVAFVLYAVLGRLGLIRSMGVSSTEAGAGSPAEPA